MIDEKKMQIARLIDIEGVTTEEIAEFIGIPPTRDKGDFTLPCFRFSKQLRKSPVMIAEELFTPWLLFRTGVCPRISITRTQILHKLFFLPHPSPNSPGPRKVTTQKRQLQIQLP